MRKEKASGTHAATLAGVCRLYAAWESPRPAVERRERNELASLAGFRPIGPKSLGDHINTPLSASEGCFVGAKQYFVCSIAEPFATLSRWSASHEIFLLHSILGPIHAAPIFHERCMLPLRIYTHCGSSLGEAMEAS